MRHRRCQARPFWPPLLALAAGADVARARAPSATGGDSSVPERVVRTQRGAVARVVIGPFDLVGTDAQVLPEDQRRPDVVSGPVDDALPSEPRGRTPEPIAAGEDSIQDKKNKTFSWTPCNTTGTKAFHFNRTGGSGVSGGPASTKVVVGNSTGRARSAGDDSVVVGEDESDALTSTAAPDEEDVAFTTTAAMSDYDDQNVLEPAAENISRANGTTARKLSGGATDASSEKSDVAQTDTGAKVHKAEVDTAEPEAGSSAKDKMARSNATRVKAEDDAANEEGQDHADDTTTHTESRTSTEAKARSNGTGAEIEGSASRPVRNGSSALRPRTLRLVNAGKQQYDAFVTTAYN